jgi:hypothetical protein
MALKKELVCNNVDKFFEGNNLCQSDLECQILGCRRVRGLVSNFLFRRDVTFRPRLKYKDVDDNEPPIEAEVKDI